MWLDLYSVMSVVTTIHRSVRGLFHECHPAFKSQHRGQLARNQLTLWGNESGSLLAHQVETKTIYTSCQLP